MDAHNAVQRIVAIVLIVGGLSFPVFAGQVHIYSGQFNLPIPANPDDTRGWMADAIIEIPYQFIITDLDVRISITHTNVFDLQIFLRSPTEKIICLNMFDVYNLDKFPRGENYKDFKDTIFDDEAETAIEQAGPPFTGCFRPIEPYRLSKFDGEDSYGTWRLQIYDMWPVDTGTLDSFELIITTPEPATAILLLLGTALITLLNPRRNLKNLSPRSLPPA